MENETFVEGGDWLSTQSACDVLAITMAELYRLIDSGRLPAFNFGGSIRLRRADVDALTASQ